MSQRATILGTLPAGAKAISIPDDGRQAVRGGLAVMFYPEQGDEWLGYFRCGITDTNFVHAFPKTNRAIVVSGGMVYLVDVTIRKPLQVFGAEVDTVLPFQDDQWIMTDGNFVRIVDSTGEAWCSERIAWDGMRDLRITGSVLTGLSYSPMDQANEWVPFSVDLITRKTESGSYRKYYEEDVQTGRKKPWWRFW